MHMMVSNSLPTETKSDLCTGGPPDVTRGQADLATLPMQATRTRYQLYVLIRDTEFLWTGQAV